MIFKGFTLSVMLLIGHWAVAQQLTLRPGFDKEEYRELMRMHSQLYDSTMTDTTVASSRIPAPETFEMIYMSPVMGLDNRWGLWRKNEKLAAINLRGTTKNPVGWLENFYAAMVPATGELKIAKDFTFQYKLADNPRAAVHLGWLIGAAFLARDILPKIDSSYKAGIREFLIMGHSQGGALSYLLNSHLHSLQKQGKLPQDIVFKTYSSASPKAGNTYYAYEYENMIGSGWGHNVVNAADWVAEVPFSVQTLDDFNPTNPFKNMDKVIGQQKLVTRIALRHAYKKLRNPSLKARKNYIRYLGDYATRVVQKTLPEFEKPVFANTSNYVRIGPTIALIPDEAYFKKYPESDKTLFVHHFLGPYLYLLERYQK